MMADWFQYLTSSPIIGSPNTTKGRSTFDGKIENISDFTKTSRREIGFHHLNSTEIEPIIKSIVRGVVGKGITFQSRTQSDKINEQFEKLAKLHAKVGYFTADGKTHKDGFCRSMLRFQALNGGVLVRYHYNADWDIPMRLELIEIARVDTSKHNPRARLVHGLQRDEYNKTTGIYLFINGYSYQSELVPMEDIIFYSNDWITIDQTLAVSKLATILPSLDDMFQYSSSEVKSAIEKAKSGAYWHTELYSTIAQSLNEMIKKSNNKDDLSDIKEMINQLAGRGVGVAGLTPILKDDTITTIDTKADSIYEALTDKLELKNAAASGSSQFGAYKDPSKANYAGLMAVTGADEADCAIEFDNLVNKFLQNYYERLFDVGIKIGAIQLSSVKFYNNKEKWLKWDILRTARIVLDVVKEATAIKRNLESGTTTHIKVYADRGLDYVEEKLKQTNADIMLIQKNRELYINANFPIPEQYMTVQELEEKNKEDIK